MSVLPSSNNSATVQIGKQNFALASQQNGLNAQGTLQIGEKNKAVTLQSNSIVSATLNASATVQVGSRNKALTSQIADPTIGANGSLIAQFGNNNTAIAAQTDRPAADDRRPEHPGDRSGRYRQLRRDRAEQCAA